MISSAVESGRGTRGTAGDTATSAYCTDRIITVGDSIIKEGVETFGASFSLINQESVCVDDMKLVFDIS